jgi:hypothetical protein
VYGSVDFNNQIGSVAIEIDNKPTDNLLAAEVEAG